MNTQKTYKIEFKALPATDSKTGAFEAIVSVFGNVDLAGDRVMPVAFDKTIQDWKLSGDNIPLIWSHDWADPHAILGSINPDDLTVTDVGLKAVGTMDLNNPFAKQVHSLMEQRLVKEFSFSYVIKDERPASDGANELWAVDLIEIGPTLKGANPETELIGVKSALEAAAAEVHSKAGARTSSGDLAKLQAIHDTLSDFGVKCAEAAAAPTEDAKRIDDELAKFKLLIAELEV